MPLRPTSGPVPRSDAHPMTLGQRWIALPSTDFGPDGLPPFASGLTQGGLTTARTADCGVGGRAAAHSTEAAVMAELEPDLVSWLLDHRLMGRHREEFLLD